MAGGFKRYNEIQKALSSHLRDKGISLKGTGKKFHQAASEIYRETKSQPLGPAIDNIDVLFEDFISTTPLSIPTDTPDYYPELTSDVLEFDAFWTFSHNYDPRNAPGNLLINSFTTSEQEVPATEFSYDNHFQEFTNFCNKNKGINWSDTSDAPKFKFTPPRPHPSKKGFYISDVVTDNEENYGFDPGDEDSEFIPGEPVEEIAPDIPEKKEDRIERAKDKAQERAVRIKELDVESKKLEVESKKQTIALFDRYEKLYDKGIISKAEFKRKVLELKL